MTFFRQGHNSSNDRTESNKKERSSRTLPYGSGKFYQSLSDDAIIMSSPIIRKWCT